MWRMTTKKRNGLKEGAAHRYMSKERRTDGPSAHQHRPVSVCPYGLLGYSYQRFFFFFCFLLMLFFVNCHRLLTHLALKVFGEIETLSHSLGCLRVNGSHHTSVVMSDSKCPAIHLDVSFFQKKIKMCGLLTRQTE